MPKKMKRYSFVLLIKGYLQVSELSKSSRGRVLFGQLAIKIHESVVMRRRENFWLDRYDAAKMLKPRMPINFTEVKQVFVTIFIPIDLSPT